MINHYLSILVDRLRAEGIGDPLAQSFTLAALWDDLAAIADEPPPAAVLAALDGPPRPSATMPDGMLASPARPARSRPGGASTRGDRG